MVGLSPPDDVRAGSRCGRGRRRSRSDIDACDVDVHLGARHSVGPALDRRLLSEAHRDRRAAAGFPRRGRGRPVTGQPEVDLGAAREQSSGDEVGNDVFADQLRNGRDLVRCGRVLPSDRQLRPDRPRRLAGLRSQLRGSGRRRRTRLRRSGRRSRSRFETRTARRPRRGHRRDCRHSPAPEWPAIGVAAAGGPRPRVRPTAAPERRWRRATQTARWASLGTWTAASWAAARGRAERRREPSSGSPAATTAVRMARPEAIATRRPSPAAAGQRHRVARARHRRRDPASPATRTATAPARARPGRCRPRAPRADPGSRSCPRELQIGGSAPRRQREDVALGPAERRRESRDIAQQRRAGEGDPLPQQRGEDRGPPRRPRRTPGTPSAASAGPCPRPARTRRPAPATARPRAPRARVRRRPARSRIAERGRRVDRVVPTPREGRASSASGRRAMTRHPARDGRLGRTVCCVPTASPTGTCTSISAPHSGQCNTHCSCPPSPPIPPSPPSPPAPLRQSAASRPRSPSGRSSAPGCSHSPAACSTAAPRASGGATAPASHAASRTAGSARAAPPVLLTAFRRGIHGSLAEARSWRAAVVFVVRSPRLAHGVPPWCSWFARRGSLMACRRGVRGSLAEARSWRAAVVSMVRSPRLAHGSTNDGSVGSPTS